MPDQLEFQPAPQGAVQGVFQPLSWVDITQLDGGRCEASHTLILAWETGRAFG
jgi:hypothetical protein